MAVREDPTAGGARDEIERLAEEFVERRRRGERPTIEEYASAHPELADGIQALFATLIVVEELGGDSSAGAAASRAPAEPSTAPGLQQVGEYRVLREIGRGGMGVVYEAEQASLGRRVALKVLPFHSLLDSKRLERFQQEARAAARLSHPNIVPVYGVGEHLGIHYYVMQFVPGQGLNRVIAEVRRLRQGGEPERDPEAGSSSSIAAGLDSSGARGGRDRYFLNVARLVRDAALALDYAHGAGILHRDVKPSNLLLDPGGRVWLTDFGLAKSEGSDELTRSGDFAGTVLYMAPERFEGWSDPRSDVYGLGMTLYELATLRPAFAERDRARLLRQVASEEPPAPRRVDRSIPCDLETVVLKAIAKEPGQRYGTARAMAADLDRFLRGLPVEARRSRALARLGRWCARNPLPALLTAAVAALLAAVAVISSVAAVRLRREQAAGEEKLRAAYLAGAGALRASARPGRRFEALEALRKAAAIRPGPDLVGEAIACFAQADLRPLKSWAKRKSETFDLSPDGSTFAVTEPGGEVAIRAAGDGRELTRLPAPAFRPSYCWSRFSPDGKRLAVRYQQGRRSEWQVWDLDRRLVAAEVKEAGNVNCAGFSPDGRWVALGTRERGVRFLDLDSGRTQGEVGGQWRVRGLAIHPGARLIAFSSDRSGRVHVYDREGGHVIRSLGGSRGTVFEQVAWHPDGKTLAAASTDHLVYLWNAKTGVESRRLQGHWAEAIGVGFHPRGWLLASWGWDPAVRFWEAGSDRPIFSIHRKEGQFSGERVFWTVTADRVELWDLAPPSPAFTLFGHEGSASKQPHSIALAPGGRLAATGGDDGVRLWDLAAQREVAHLDDGKVMSVLFDAAGENLISSGWTGLRRRRLRAVGRGRIALGPPRRLTQLESWQRAAVGGGDRKIAAVHAETHAHLFDPALPEGATVLSGLPSSWTIALSPDGAWAAAGSWYGEEVWIWDLRGGEPGGVPVPVRMIPAPRGEVKFHPGGNHLAVSTPEECTLWRLADGEVTWRVARERGLALAGPVAFDRHGRVAAISRSDTKIWLVDAMSGRKLADFEASEPVLVSSLAIEGGTLAASTHGRRIHIWDLNAIAKEIAGLGLTWEVPAEGQPLRDLTPLRVAVAEESTDLLLDETSDLAPRRLFRPARAAAFMSELVTCAEIDRALACPAFLISEGEPWKLFRGRAEPSPGMEWTALEYDDAGWESGRSPLSGWNDPESEGTFLAEQPGSYTTLYLRRAFEASDPAPAARLFLALEVEDGFVAYLNGEEVGRAQAGAPGERLGFQALARRSGRTRVTEVVEISPARLRPGRNLLAIQALSCGQDSRLHLLPVLAAVPAPDAERDRRRTENLIAGEDGAPEASLLAYREGRILQRAGKIAEALAQFERASEIDRSAVEPLLRRIACHRALGELARTEALAREAIEAGEILDDGRLWRAWHQAVLVDLGRTPAAALASLPRDPRAGSQGGASDHRVLLEELSAHGAIRINCGGGDLVTQEGKRWSRDRFFRGGAALDRGTLPECLAPPASRGDEALHRSQRSFSGEIPFREGYSIPLPPGPYRVSLHFTEWTHHEAGRRVFDVILEGETVLEIWDPLGAGFGVPAVRSFEVAAGDGVLTLDLIAHRDTPRLSAIEVEVAAE